MYINGGQSKRVTKAQRHRGEREAQSGRERSGGKSGQAGGDISTKQERTLNKAVLAFCGQCSFVSQRQGQSAESRKV